MVPTSTTASTMILVTAIAMRGIAHTVIAKMQLVIIKHIYVVVFFVNNKFIFSSLVIAELIKK